MLKELAQKCPSLEHLNLMKNPCNPVFSNELQYSEFRARFSIWIPSLKTLDGTDFKDDQGFITKMRQTEQEKKVKSGIMMGDAIMEESFSQEQSMIKPSKETSGGGQTTKGVPDKSMKASAGTTNF